MKTAKRILCMLLALLMIASLAVSFVGCTDDDDDVEEIRNTKKKKENKDEEEEEEEEGPQVVTPVEWDGTPQYGGHINVRSNARPTGLDPLKQTGTWKYQWTTAVYEPFLTRDSQNKIQPCVCDYVMESYVDESGLKHDALWIWPREGYTFSHGYGQVEMDDIVASFERGLYQYANIKKYVRPNITVAEVVPATDAVKAKDPSATQAFHLDFKYHEKNLYYFASWRTWWPVMPKEICEKYSTSYIMNQLEDAVGTGPYTFTEFKDSTYVTLTKRNDYIPVDNTGHTGLAGTKYGYLDSMTFWYNGNDASAAACVLAGEYDCTDTIPEEYTNQATASGITPSKLFSDQRLWIFFNTMGTNNVVAKYPSLRKAVMAAIDYPTFLEFVTNDSQILDTDQLLMGGESGIYNFVTKRFKDADYYGAYNQKIVDKYMAMARQEGYQGEPLQIPHHTGRTDIPSITAATMERAGINYELVANEFSVHSAFIGDPSNNWDFYFASSPTYYTPGVMADSLVRNNFKSDRILEIREVLMPALDPTSQEYLALWEEWADIWVEGCQVGYMGAADWYWWHPEDLVINDGGDDPNDLCEQRFFYNTYWKYPEEHPKF